MNVLIVGGGNGSFQMRGVQLGAALGARVTSDPVEADWRWADVVVLVKKAAGAWAVTAHRFDVPIVWDALDFWSQPRENQIGETQARALLHRQIAAIRPVLTIGATEAMAEACGGVYLPHHSRSGTASVRRDVKVVAYEGGAAFLCGWLGIVSRACVARGWRFEVNPPDIRSADIVVALRDGPWDGWQCREWKSGVKLVNALAAGRPVITQQSAAMREIGAVGSVVETPGDLECALDVWASWEWRVRASEECEIRSPAYTLTEVAGRYRQILAEKVSPCMA